MENLFSKLLKTGNMRFDEDKLTIFNAYQIILPISVFLELRKLIFEKCPSEAENILRGIGRYQFEQSFKRYDKLLKIEKLNIEKTVEFFMNHASLMGFGKFNFVKFQKNPLFIILTNTNNPIATEYKILFGESKEPIDVYFCGLLEAAYSKFLRKNMECKETLCIAKGDKICQFEIIEK